MHSITAFRNHIAAAESQIATRCDSPHSRRQYASIPAHNCADGPCVGNRPWQTASKFGKTGVFRSMQFWRAPVLKPELPNGLYICLRAFTCFAILSYLFFCDESSFGSSNRLLAGFGITTIFNASIVLYLIIVSHISVRPSSTSECSIRKTGKILRWLKCHLMWLIAVISFLNMA